MNALVASVIRTLVPVIVGQVAGWLLLINVTLPTTALDGLSAFLGGALTAVYYVGVRVLEQQWPQAGVLLGLTATPDTYSKGDPASEPAAPAVETPAAPAAEPVVPDAVITVKPQTEPDLAASTQAAVDAATPAAAPYPAPTA